MQLTGRRIPDILLSNTKTIDHLLRAFSIKEPAKKLHDSEQLQKLSYTSPNIQVHETRRTHVHKDKEMGRWKLIEEEMNARGMPTRGGGVLAGRNA